MLSLQPDIPSPRKLFATVSLLMIAAMLAMAGVTLATFFRQTVLEREAGLVRDLVNALVSEHAVAPVDLSDYNEPASRDRLEHSFGPLRGLQDVQKIKVFNQDHTIIWSDDQQLIGTQRTAHLDHLLAALRGDVKAVFNPGVASSTFFDFGAPRPQNIEFYVPLLVPNASGGRDVMGAMALYRSPERLNEDLWRGMTRLGLIVGGTCLLLFAALYWLFSIVHSKQQSIERQFTKLSADQNRLVQIEKMSAMGELVGQIAHQLNNPLIGVLNMTQLAEREADNPVRVRELLAEVRKGGAECRDIIQRILRLNRSASSDPQLVNIAELIRDTIKFCQMSVHPNQPVNFNCQAEDVTLFIELFSRKFGRPTAALSPEAVHALETAFWPGNVRQLKHAIERAVAVNGEGPITAASLALPQAPAGAEMVRTTPLPYREARQEFESEYFSRLLEFTEGNVSESSRLSGLARQNIYTHLRQAGIDMKS